MPVQKTKVSIWLYDNNEMRLEGRIIVCTPLNAFTFTFYSITLLYTRTRIAAVLEFTLFFSPLLCLCALSFRNADHYILHVQGFDEFMNVVMDDAAEVYLKEAKPRRELGLYLLTTLITLY